MKRSPARDAAVAAAQAGYDEDPAYWMQQLHTGRAEMRERAARELQRLGYYVSRTPPGRKRPPDVSVGLGRRALETLDWCVQILTTAERELERLPEESLRSVLKSLRHACDRTKNPRLADHDGEP